MFDDWDYSHPLMSPSYNELVATLKERDAAIARVLRICYDPPEPSRMLIPLIREAIHGPTPFTDVLEEIVTRDAEILERLGDT